MIAHMRLLLVMIAVVFLLVELGGVVRPVRTTNAAPANQPVASSEPKARVDFDAQLKPIFQSKCMPCHFSGGKVYDRLPFDKPATIKKLGTRLFTRIKDEQDRKLIEDFLTQD
jgi:hypothetical protein